MSSITISAVRPRTSILDRSLSKGKGEVSLSCFALLFSELVQYCQNRVYTVPELQNKLAEIGAEIGHRVTDLLVVREKADKLEHANDDERTYYIIEKEALVNKFVSVPKDKGSLNCASFTAGIVEAVLCDCGFPAKVTAHWHKGTTYMVKFDDAVIARDKQLEER
ncbi:hypothetical protein HZH66_005807 [Vespula vulgaris]|uniref:Trafficking protein particle complex subunit 5 n=1 Tax=Vespula vulgaris TaxID=7454 RepID=A0A834NAT1_VESVU|nr:hypothetical protein HZH66_005807 [Vespula vulgaris]